MVVRTVSETVFACHTRACRPPTSGGTGGSSPSKGSARNDKVSNKAAQTHLRQIKKSFVSPTTAGPEWGARNSGSRVGWQSGRHASGKERLEKDGYVHVVEPEGRSSWKRTTTKDGKKVKGSLHTTRQSAQRSAEKYVEGGSSRFGGNLVKDNKYA